MWDIKLVSAEGEEKLKWIWQAGNFQIVEQFVVLIEGKPRSEKF